MIVLLKSLWQPSLVRRLLAVQLVACAIVAVAMGYALFSAHAGLKARTIDRMMASVARTLLRDEDPERVLPPLQSAFDHYLTHIYDVPVDMFGASLRYEIRDAEGRRVVVSKTPPDDEAEGLHVFTEHDIASGRTAIVALPEQAIGHLWEKQIAERVVSLSALGTFLIVAPPFLVLMFLLARLSLRPLRDLADELSSRNPAQSAPLRLATDYVELAPVLTQLNAQFAQLDRLRSQKQQFFLDVAHEILTPVAALRAQAFVLSRTTDATVRAREVARMNEVLVRVARMIRQILNISRMDAMGQTTLGVCDIASLVTDRAEMLASLASSRGVHVSLRLSAEVRLNIDESSMSAAIDSLLENAIRYVPPTGCRVEVSLFGVEDGFELVVADDGPGIAPEYRDAVFDRFYRVPGTQQEGSGLGLPIVKQAVELHGGRVWLSTGIAGRGLAVHILLPSRSRSDSADACNDGRVKPRLFVNGRSRGGAGVRSWIRNLQFLREQIARNDIDSNDYGFWLQVCVLVSIAAGYVMHVVGLLP